MALCSNFNTSVDGQNRARLSAKLRHVLGTNYVLMPGIDGCIYVLPDVATQPILSAISNSESLDPVRERLNRRLLSNSEKVEADAQGRFTIPTKLLRYAGIVEEIVIVGNNSKAEIWSKEKWDADNSDMGIDEANSMFAQLAEYSQSKI